MNPGDCYLWGHAVEFDEAEALRLFRRAVERGEESVTKSRVRFVDATDDFVPEAAQNYAEYLDRMTKT